MINQKVLSLALILSLLVNLIMVYELTLVLRQNNSLMDQIKTLLVQNENLSSTIVNLRQEIENLRSQVEYYRLQAEYYSSFIRGLETNISLIGETEINIVAVRELPEGFFTIRYEGLVLRCKVELRIGSGRVLVNTVPRIGIDLQTSAQTALRVAEKFTAKPLSSTDVIITILAQEEVYIVDGPSAGAAIAIAIIAAIEGRRLSDEIFITGTVMPDGTIGKVGGVAEKAEAAAAKGGTIFLVPKGQGVITVYKRVEKSVPPFTFITLEPVKVSLQEYLSQRGYNMRVYEVSSISEAYEYFVRCS